MHAVGFHKRGAKFLLATSAHTKGACILFGIIMVRFGIFSVLFGIFPVLFSMSFLFFSVSFWFFSVFIATQGET